MNVILIGPAYPLRGGLATFNERLSRQFLSEGHHITIYTFSLQYPSFLFPGKSQLSTEPKPSDLDIEVCINSVNPFNWHRIGNIISAKKPDLVVVRYWLPFMGPCMGYILRRIKKNKHTKIVCIADNIIPHEKRPGDNLFTKYFVKPVDAFITMSEKVLEDLTLFAPLKPKQLVLHPLYDNFGEKMSKEEARNKLGIDMQDFVCLFFGFIRTYKGLDILLDAVTLIKDKIPGFKLLIAGEFYTDKNIYDTQIDKNGIREHLILHTDFIPDSDVKYYMCAADVVIQPYRQATQSGVTPLAYHFEIPMIVTNVGGLPALVPDNKAGLVAEPNAQSLMEKIIAYHTKTENHFLPYLKEEKKKFSWAKMTKSITEIGGL